jgi:apolipoprotein N-acyltransferase
VSGGVRPGWWCLVAGLAYGALLTLAWPPVSLWWLAFVTPLPLVLVGEFAARKRMSARGAGVLAALGSLPFWFLQTRWLIDVTIAGYPCMAIYMSAYVGLFVALLARARRERPAIPLWAAASLLWVGLEVLRGEFVLTGYPWFLSPHPLVERPILAAPAAIVGAYGVSLLLMTAIASAAQLGCRGRHPLIRPLTALLGAGALWIGLGVLARATEIPSAGSIRVTIVQTNLPQSNKIGWALRDRVEAFQAWLGATVEAAKPDSTGKRPDAVLWPETMFPGDALNPEAVAALAKSGLVWPASMLGPDAPGDLRCDAFAAALTDAQREMGVPMIVGAIAIDGLRVEHPQGKIHLAWDAKYNSALLVTDGLVSPDRYDKHSLTPFGEAIPYAWRLPALQRGVLALGAGGMSFDLSWGERSGPLVIPTSPTSGVPGAPGVRGVTPICFEVVRSALCRRLVHEGDESLPVLLVNLSNDGWFTRWPEGRAQHLQIARWRTIELGVPMVRTVNTGISGAIDARGNIIALVPHVPPSGANDPRVCDIETLDVPVARASATVFSRWVGNGVGYGCLVAGVLLAVAGRRRTPVASNPGVFPPPPPRAPASSPRTTTP